MNSKIRAKPSNHSFLWGYSADSQTVRKRLRAMAKLTYATWSADFLARLSNFHSRCYRTTLSLPSPQREKGNMAQAMPMPTTKKRSSDHKIYFTRSFGRRRPRNPKAIEITTENSKNACKCVNCNEGTPFTLFALALLHTRAARPADS